MSLQTRSHSEIHPYKQPRPSHMPAATLQKHSAEVTYSTIEPHLISIPEGMRRLSCGRSFLYQLMDQNKFRSVRLGGRRLVDAASLAEFAASLQHMSGKDK